MSEELFLQISQLSETPFEKELAESSINQLNDKTNKLRVNNFAYSMRELTRTILERLAPDESVRATVWFKCEDPKKPNMVTRGQRIKYAIQKGLSDEYIDKLGLSTEAVVKKLKKNIDVLSKYTHVTEKTFNSPDEKVNSIVSAVTEAFIGFINTITECREQLERDIENFVDEEVVKKLFFDTLNDIDWLATHYEVEDYCVNSIKLVHFDNTSCCFDVEGSVGVRLQYGSDGDMKKGDGFEIHKSFPFSTNVTSLLLDGEIVYQTGLDKFDIDTDSFWE